MTEKTDLELCSACRSGDDSAMEQLLTRHRNYLWDVAREYYNSNAAICRKLGLSEDDLFQIGQMKIWKLASDYEPERGTKFHTYCKMPLVHAMTDAVRSGAKAQKYELENSDYDWDPETEKSAELAQFRYPEPEPAFLKKETLEELRAALAQISATDRTYLTYRFGLEDGECRSQAAAARYFSLRPGSQKRAEQEALCHIRQQMP